MRKQALVHLHALCTLLREYLQNREEFSEEAIDPGSVPTSPAAIHRPKDEHRRAVEALATEVATAVDAGGEHDYAPDGGTVTPGGRRPDSEPEAGSAEESTETTAESE
jgi:hypothetical protein